MTAKPPQVPAYRDPTQDKNPNLTAVGFLLPLCRRPKLFIALMILLVAWLATIIVMRLTTVHRDPIPPTQAPVR